MLTKPVLFLIFNRIDTTQKVFEAIRQAKPPRFYIACDGAREDKVGEAEKVQKIRDFVLSNIDWKCEVKTLFRDKNLGCGHAVSDAITWFFDNEEDGIILEDDCLPHPTFFTYCETLLEFYKDNKNVWHIAGANLLNNVKIKESYYFTKIQGCWGWATWRNRWLKYSFNLQKYDENLLKNFSYKKYIQKYWKEILHRMQKFEIDTWDYQWVFTINKYNGLCINPARNLISNIGITGVHYSDANDHPFLNMPVYQIDAIIHPKKVKLNKSLVNQNYKYVFHIKHVSFKSFIKKILRIVYKQVHKLYVK